MEAPAVLTAALTALNENVQQHILSTSSLQLLQNTNQLFKCP